MSDSEAEKLYQAGVEAASAGDFESAVRLWEAAAGLGHAKAQYNLGVAYARGKGVGVDQTYARRLWSRAADQGHKEAAKRLAALPPDDPQPRASGRSALSSIAGVYIGIGSLFALVKFGSLAAWTLFGSIGRPDLPWYWRMFGEMMAVAINVPGAVLTAFVWPYYVYVFASQGMSAFLRDMFFLWY